MSSSTSTSNTTIGLLLAVAVTTTAATTYVVTKRNEENKVLKEKKEIYNRELLIKNKTLEARRLAGEPMSGTLIEGVSIDRVYLWEVEDLKKRFPSSKAPNFMKQIPMPSENPYFFPALRKAASSDSMTDVNDTTTSSRHNHHDHSHKTNYNQLITNHECILGSIVRKPNQITQSHAFVRAGPRRYLHFDTDQVNAAIVTCGGLCPGLNNVIREITNTLCQTYGIGGKIYGIQGGFRGFWETASQYQPIELTPELVANIHHEGGTVLGSSRGGFDLDKILAFLEKFKINQLYVIGGDGTHRGAFAIHEGCMEHVSVFVVCDFCVVSRCFGFRRMVLFLFVVGIVLFGRVLLLELVGWMALVPFSMLNVFFVCIVYCGRLDQSMSPQTIDPSIQDLNIAVAGIPKTIDNDGTSKL